MISKILAFIYPGDIESREIRSKIKREVLSDIFATLFWHLIFIPVFVFLYASLLIKSVELSKLLVWYGAVLLAFFPPVLYVYRQYRHNDDGFDLFRAERILAVFAAITGFLVGISTWLFFDVLSANMAMFMVVSLSLGPAVSAAAFAGSMRIWICITLALMSPIISYVYFRLDFASLSGEVFAFWLLVYSIYMFFVAYRQHKSMREKLILKYQLQQAVKNKSRYMAAASHDIRQPLHAMSYFVHSLKNEFPQHRTIVKLQQSLESLNNLMDSLLDISRLESNMVKVNIEPVSMFDVLKEVKNLYIQQAQKKQVRLQVESEHVYAKTDKVLLARILGNLLDNALKYTPSEGKVKLRCYRDEDHVLLTVEDNGCGIGSEEQGKIFREFYQIKDKRIKQNHGLGLGLAIVYKMARLANIEVSLSSVVGKGSCFVLKLPLSTLEPVPDAETNTKLPVPSGQVIGVIDDQQSILDALEIQLCDWGYSCICALNSESFCNKAKNSSIALLLCDFVLEGENGIEAIEKVRRCLQTSLPAILITASSDQQSLEQISQSGFTVLKKPVKPARLRASIISQLGQGSQGSVD